MSAPNLSDCKLAICCAALSLAACGGGGSDDPPAAPPAATPTASRYVATNLVSDVGGTGSVYAASNTDAHLVNGWGIAFNPTGFVWVSNNHSSTSTLYDGNGVVQSLVVDIPPGAGGDGDPTGIVFNGTGAFAVTQGGVTGTSPFIFAGESGTISGWSPAVNRTHAVTVVDKSASATSYKGLAIATQGASSFIYASDFHNGVVDVFDSNFAPVVTPTAFTDASLPAGYAPFGIQAIGGLVYVAYAKQDSQRHDEEAGAGFGAVDVFDAAGSLVKRLIPAGGRLNAPWGMALAPANFGSYSNALLVGNFGDGTINAFDATTGAYLGTLSKPDGSAIVVDGLWGMAFGNGVNSQPVNTLFFAAGPAGETHGVYGRIDAQ